MLFSTEIADFFCQQCIADQPPAKFFIWAGLATAGTLFCLLKTRSSYKKFRLIEDIPTSRIRSASQGFTELVGVGRLLAEPLTSPLTSLPCLWWRYTIERYQKSSSKNAGSWVTVESKTSDAPFNIDDGTGMCKIFPAGAELSSRHKERWYGNSRQANRGLFNKVLARQKHIGGLDLGGFGRRYRFTEHLIIDGDPLYTLGHFETDATGRRTLSIGKIMGDILIHWKQDFGALLEKYDANGDGELCLKEWQQVRVAAEKAALKQQKKYSALPAEHIVRKPESGGLPFIISSTGQDKLSKSFRMRARLFAAGFLLIGSSATWLWTSRFL